MRTQVFYVSSLSVFRSINAEEITIMPRRDPDLPNYFFVRVNYNGIDEHVFTRASTPLLIIENDQPILRFTSLSSHNGYYWANRCYEVLLDPISFQEWINLHSANLNAQQTTMDVEI